MNPESAKYYYAVKNETLGPVPVSFLEDLKTRGEITDHTKVCLEGGNNTWVLLGNLLSQRASFQRSYSPEVKKADSLLQALRIVAWGVAVFGLIGMVLLFDEQPILALGLMFSSFVFSLLLASIVRALNYLEKMTTEMSANK